MSRSPALLAVLLLRLSIHPAWALEDRRIESPIHERERAERRQSHETRVDDGLRMQRRWEVERRADRAERRAEERHQELLRELRIEQLRR